MLRIVRPGGVLHEVQPSLHVNLYFVETLPKGIFILPRRDVTYSFTQKGCYKNTKSEGFFFLNMDLPIRGATLTLTKGISFQL